MAAAVAAAVAAQPPSSKRRWQPEADAELLQLAGSADHRQRLLGSVELDWEAVGRHFGRSGRAVQDRYRMLSKEAGRMDASASSAAGSAAPSAPAHQQEAADSGRFASEGESGQQSGGSGEAVAEQFQSRCRRPSSLDCHRRASSTRARHL